MEPATSLNCCGDCTRCSGLVSGSALATVVGVLIEVPVMLSVCPSATGRGTGLPETEGID